jgi:hypothetical protein
MMLLLFALEWMVFWFWPRRGSLAVHGMDADGMR